MVRKALIALVAAVLAFDIIVLIIGSQSDIAHKPIKNPYYPFTVELEVRDR